MNFKKSLTLAVAAIALTASLGTAQAAGKRDSFRIAWTIYAGWIPWDYVKTSGIMESAISPSSRKSPSGSTRIALPG